MKTLKLKKINSLNWLLPVVLLLGAAWLCQPQTTVMAQRAVITDATLTQAVATPARDQSFGLPQAWAGNLTAYDGWGTDHPRMLADANGDKRQDIVGFGNDGVWLATSTLTPRREHFITAFVLADFGYNQGWRVQKHVRTTGDINGDKLDDVVGFGEAGVYRALSTGTGFAPATFVVANFGYNQGWRVERHVRLLADVNGDGRKDIVAFGDDGVWLSLATPSGYFSAPAFVLANFGFNQGWTPELHIRTTADLNGDGRQDLVGFGNDGVWTALSTGSGFGPAQFVLADFGYVAGGWRVDRHPRLLADINGDGKQDIVAFGDDGVWIARSAGNGGFAAAQFVLADFGYNQGWRIGTHPRFVADLNGDGYQDIVGYGQEAIIRALGRSYGFEAPRPVLRALVVEQRGFASDSNPRFVGDANGDGKQDLVAFGDELIEVALSSDLPPPPPPAVPSNPRITSKTTTTLTLEWDHNSVGVRQFIINYGKAGSGTQTLTLDGGVTTHTFGSLDSNTSYCFTVQAENIWGVSAESARECDRTGIEQPPPPNKGPFTITINMRRQDIVQGFVPYLGTFGPIFTGAVISKINFPTQFPAVLLVKKGHSTNECGNPAAVVLAHGDLTADQKKAVWGSATLSITGQQSLPFLGCTTSSQLPGLLPVNITWSQP